MSNERKYSPSGLFYYTANFNHSTSTLETLVYNHEGKVVQKFTQTQECDSDSDVKIYGDAVKGWVQDKPNSLILVSESTSIRHGFEPEGSETKSIVDL